MNHDLTAGIGSIAGSRFFMVCCLIVLLSISSCKKDAQKRSTELTWITQDGFTQQGTLYTPNKKNAPALILVHALGGQRSDWEFLALRAAARGYLVLTYDMRGHGDSATRNGKSSPFNRFESEDWNRAVADIGLAKRQILANGASPENLFIVGASIGANMTVQYADADPEIQAVVLLSPGVKYKNLDIENTVKDNRRLPMLLMAAEGDRYSADSIDKMKIWSPAYAESRMYSGTSHGIDLLLRSERIFEDIFGWLKPILK